MFDGMDWPAGRSSTPPLGWKLACAARRVADSPLATSPGLRITKVAQAKMAAFLFAAAGKGAVASLIASLAHVNNHTYHRAPKAHSGSSK